ncbi:MAG: sugar-binding domain-containing protein, partial [Streptococcus mitis]|nr:sugar-binding domain-containing protein [Streptococcus mitis]
RINTEIPKTIEFHNTFVGNISQLFESYHLKILWNSIVLGISVLILSTVIALPLSFIMTKTTLVKHQWLDMLTEDDFKELTKVKTVGEICCRFFDSKGKEVYENLQERTIAISLEDLKNIPQSLAVAYGDTKVSAILSVLRANLVNHLITDKNTILQVLEEDGDFSFRDILCE